MKPFSRAVRIILGHEGGYADDPNDNGGRTKWGISQAAYPTLDIKSLTREDAEAIYFRDYWLAAHCDELPWWAAIATFDCAVNQGVWCAVRILQEAVGAKVDGKLGPKTLAAVEAANPSTAVATMQALRSLRYARHPDWKRYGKGWMKRAFLVAIEAMKEE